MRRRHSFGRYKYQESGLKIRRPIERYIMRAISVGMIAFLATFISSSIFAPVELTDATEVLFSAQATGGAVSLSTSGNINISMATNSTGSVRTVLDPVTVSSEENGYQLYISATGNTNALIRDGAVSTGTDATTGAPTYATSDIIPTLTNSNNLVPISSPTNLENNTWGFAVPAKNTTSGSGSEDVVTNGFDASYPTGDNSSASSKFASIPTKGNDILIAKRSSTATSVPTNFYYGVKATSSKPSGLYTNTITYTAIGDSNVDGLASITPERTNQLAGGVTLDVATPSTLALSSISSVSITVGGQTCSNAVAYKNGSLVNITCSSPALATGWHEVIATITTTSSTTETYVVNPGIEYYSDAETIASTMQDFTLAQCNAMNTGQSAILSDTRDGKTYSIAKQADGNCWMTQNLRLGDPNRDITLTSADSDVSFDFTIPAIVVQTSGNSSWSSDIDAVHAYSFAGTTHEEGYGALYNWYTATASSGTTSITSGDAYSSICPKGWKLPTKTGDGSYINLLQATGILDSNSAGIDNAPTTVKRLTESPLNMARSGYYYSGLATVGDYGLLWSRTASTSDNAFYLLMTSGYVSTLVSTRKKDNGFAVRCVMVTAEPTYMQELTSAYCNNMATAATMTLTDVRDQNTYSVTKQADGNCWMTQSLRIGTTSDGTGTQNVTLTSANSDITGPTPQTLVSNTNQIYTGNSKDWSGISDYGVYSFANTADVTTYGNMYNWYTATAGSGDTTTNSGNAPMSICPSHWRLPVHSGNGSYANLLRSAIDNSMPSSGTNTTYTTAFQNAPLNFVLSGEYNTGKYAQGQYGAYWTSLSIAASYAHVFLFSTSGGYKLGDSAAGDFEARGFAVRCVFVP